MRVLSLTCNHCGAPLEVPAKTKFVNCGFCKARLEIHRSGGAVYTEVLEQIDERTEKIAEDVETIKLQNQLERLDREWVTEKDRYAVRGKDGEYSIPTAAGSLTWGGAVAIFAVFWIGMTISVGAPIIFPLFGLGLIAFTVFGCMTAYSKANNYQQRKDVYDRERHRIVQELRRRR